MGSLWTIKCAAGTFDKRQAPNDPYPVVCILVTLLFSTLLHVVTRLWAVSFLQSLQRGEYTHEENRAWFLSSRKQHSTYKVTLIYLMLSPPQRPLCVVRRLGRGKNEREGKERKRGISLFPSSSARFLFFYFCYFYWDTQREPLRRIEYLTQLFTLNLHVK